MTRFNWGSRGIDRAINIVRKLEKEYNIEADHIEGLCTILFDIAQFGYAGDE